MNLKLGSKNGKNNRRLFFLNRKRKLHLEEIEKEEKNRKQEIEKQKKNDNIINVLEIQKKNNINEVKVVDTNYHLTRKKIKSVGKNNTNQPLISKDEINEIEQILKDNVNQITLSKEKQNITNVISKNKVNNTDKTIKQEIKINPSIKNEIKDTHEFSISKNEKSNIYKDKPKQQENINSHTKTNNEKQVKQKIINDKDYIEKQIIKILDQQMDENRFQLKKMDSELHAIQNEIDNLDKEEDVLALEKEIEKLIERINKIKKQIESIKKTFEFNFPVDDPDNYLIYLVDEYKSKIKCENQLSEKLEQNKDFKSIIDKIIEIEEKQELLLEKTQERKDKLELDNEQVEKLNNDIINIENMKKRIEEMFNNQQDLLNEIKIKLDETVIITEKVNYITKTVNHSLFDLLLLMSILKHNLSIKSNVVAAVSAKMALDMILKMTTPKTKKVITKVSDVKDYESLISVCLNDTEKLERVMDENLNNLSSIRYTFEHDYKECSYLDSYKESLDKLISLENEMNERKNDVKKIKRDTQLQLEKNNAKVKKYGSLSA